MTMYEAKEEKRRLRELYALKRMEIKSPEKDEALLRHALRLRAQSFFVYYSFGAEADTRALIKALLAEGKTVCLPRIASEGMIAAEYKGEPLKRGRLGIYEPPSPLDTPCEIALVPLLAVDGEGRRLGYGGGYYDRYFALHPRVLRVGLCYQGQVVSVVPFEEHDVRLHAIVTEEGLQNLTGRPLRSIIRGKGDKPC